MGRGAWASQRCWGGARGRASPLAKVAQGLFHGLGLLFLVSAVVRCATERRCPEALGGGSGEGRELEWDFGWCPSLQGLDGELGVQDGAPRQAEVPAEKPEVQCSQQHTVAESPRFTENYGDLPLKPFKREAPRGLKPQVDVTTKSQSQAA